jgi:hypothetical protein
MLAALLCNLTPGPPPPPKPPAFRPRFGGGPFWKRYGYDPRYYRQEDEEEELSEPQAEIVEAAIDQAVGAIRTEAKPQPIVLDAKRIFERVFSEVQGIERERVREIWRAEIKRRLQQDDEGMIVCLMCL